MEGQGKNITKMKMISESHIIDYDVIFVKNFKRPRDFIFVFLTLLHLTLPFLSPHLESDNSDSQSPRSPKLCYGCKQPIQDLNWLHISPDINWHASCLACSECHMVLDEKHTCFMKDGRTYCRKDFVGYVCMYIVCVCVRML